MNILVCIKQVPATSKVEVDPDTGLLKRDGADSKMNPYDLYALETAIRLRDKEGGKVTVLSMGPLQAESIIREAFAMGADAGALLSDRRFGGADVLATAYAISQGIKHLGEFDLILCGKQTTDGDTAQVGPEISEYLEIPSVADVTKINEVTKENMTVEMELPEALEVVKVDFPCLLTVEKDIYQPRLPSYVLKKAAKGREIPIYTLDDMDDQDEDHYGLTGSPTQVKKIFPPKTNTDHFTFEGNDEKQADQLCDKLAELKFI
ncbi:electron transfer flavoprotein subunit beta/FixA family protein [Agrilactobacillus yilanensis]|uniref:Electron transfer flavoprotein small subunit n=1 Tax=Agrilactobacillus yilanensis TaxID=2485997 RepID=A0ABW4J4L2_9LACO|nr:electron transfer flavoprotein subunit beta/FixA family protein [Agrilactobacillus yilanensis]